MRSELEIKGNCLFSVIVDTYYEQQHYVVLVCFWSVRLYIIMCDCELCMYP